MPHHRPRSLTALIALLMTAPLTAQAPNTARAHEALRASPSENSGRIRLGTLDQTRYWAPTSTWSAPKFSHSENPDDWDLFTPHPRDPDGGDGDALLGSPLAYPMAPIRNTLDRLAFRDIKVTIYDLLIYQNVSRTLDPALERDSLVNRFDTRVSARLWDLEGQGSGVFTSTVRVNNNVLGTATSTEAAGAFSSLDVVASDTSFLINRFEFEQAFLENRLFVTVGKGNPNDTIASNLFAWDETKQFIAATFDGGNYPVGYSGYLPLISVQAIPTAGLYVTGTVSSGLGTGYQLFSTVGEGLYWCAGEVGAVVEIGAEERQGRYSIAIMNSNTGNDTVDRATRVSGNAMAIVAQQQVADSAAIWSQYLLSSGEIGPAQQELTLGFSVDGCFGRMNDGFGIALGWSDPSDSAYPGWRQRVQLETYYRLQLTESWQLSPDLQVLSRPSDPNAEDRPVWVLGLRLLTEF